jgi:hypothetical protein
MSKRLAAIGQAVSIQEFSLTGASQTRTERNGLTDANDILGLLRELRCQRGRLNAGDQLRVGEEACLKGQPFGTLDLRPAGGKLRMETLGPRQRVRQTQAFQALSGRSWGRRLLRRGRAEGHDDRSGSHHGWPLRCRPSRGRDVRAACQHHEPCDRP